MTDTEHLEFARLRVENEVLWEMVALLRQDTSAGYSRGRIRSSRDRPAPAPVPHVPLDV